MMVDIADNRGAKISIRLEEYIPLKVLVDRKNEPVKNISFFKEKSSLLEISVGSVSGLIKRITLLMSKEYEICKDRLNIDGHEVGNPKIDAELKNNCMFFKTYVYEDGVKIVVAKEKVFRYAKIDKLFVGLSNLGRIIEICLCQLTPTEVKHICKELYTT